MTPVSSLKRQPKCFPDVSRKRAPASSVAVKRVLAWQLQQAMAEKRMCKNQMARAMQTSRSQLDRILDPRNDRVQLGTVIKAARVLGREVRIELI